MAKESTYGLITPVLTDYVRVIDDPAGTPLTRNTTLTSIRTLLQANFTTLTASTSLAIAGNATLTAPSANVLELANSTTAQTLRVFNTRTDASNGEWGAMRWNSNVLEIGSFQNGTGTARAINFIFNGTSRFAIASTISAALDFVGGSGNEIQGFRALYEMNDTHGDLPPNAAGRWSFYQTNGAGSVGADGDMICYNRSAANATNIHILPHQGAQTDYILVSDGTTGGTSSAGAGNQYVEITVNGTTYKVLHDGTV